MKITRLLIIALGTLAVAVGSNVCGPSLPSNFVVVTWDGSGATKAEACSALNMDVAAITTLNADEASVVIMSCLGDRSHALISTWEGESFGRDCLAGHVSTAIPGLTISPLASCEAHNSVLCMGRRHRSVTFPRTTTTVTSSTSVGTSTTTTTITNSYTTEATTTTSTARSLPTDACSSTNGQYVAIRRLDFVYADAEALCQDYGMQLASVTDMSDIGLDACLLSDTFYYVKTLLPQTSNMTLIAASKLGSVNIQQLVIYSVDAPWNLTPTHALCERLVSVGGVMTPVYSYSLSPLSPVSYQTAEAACLMEGQILASYPVTSPYMAISGLPDVSFMLSKYAIPLDFKCACILRAAPVPHYRVEFLTRNVDCTTMADFVAGAICKLPQAPHPAE